MWPITATAADSAATENWAYMAVLLIKFLWEVFQGPVGLCFAFEA